MDEREVREEKLAELREAGTNPFPPRLEPPRTGSIAEVLTQFDALAEAKTTVTLAGRIVLIRDKKVIFMNIEDGSGRIQVYFRPDDFGDAYAGVRKLDRGDIIAITGFLFTTRTGERTLHAQAMQILAKSLAGLPEKHAGLQDTELRYRKRYLDLIANREEELPIFVTRARTISALRRYLDDHGYLEVETPVLQPIFGGATAKPFKTHHNALVQDMFLRIAPELYLKRLVVGGIERVYEVARNFRNEGIDRSHNPEFTMLEFYEAYADYTAMMTRIEELIVAAAQAAIGSLTFTWQGHTVDLTPPWRRITLHDAIAEYTGIDYDQYADRESLSAIMQEKHIPFDARRGWGRLIDELKDAMFRSDNPALLQPLILYDYPIDLSPLAKQKPGAPGVVERFQVHLAGMQLATAFTELNDPQDQRARFEDQLRQRAEGDDEAQVMDEDYVEALEVGMPPAGGVGVGIDRLVMAFTGHDHIREVILFPTMRMQG